MFSHSTKRRLNYAISLQQRELRSDAAFFGAVGAFLGFAANTIVRAQEKGLKVSLSAVNDLLSDFMSIKATILIFVLASLMCAIRNIATYRNSRHAVRLEAIAGHSTARLRQFGSSITCFSLGFGAALALTVFGSFDPKALLLAGLVAVVGGSTSCFSVLGTALHRGIGETRELWASVLILIAAVCYLLFVLARGFS